MKYIKYSCIIFCVKIFEYSQIIYWLQEKSTHFDLQVSVSLYVFYCFEYFLIYILGQNVSKNQTRKILNYIKSFYVLNSFKYFGNKMSQKLENFLIHAFWFSYVHYFRLPKISASLAPVQQILQLRHCRFYLSLFHWPSCLNHHIILT